MRIIAGTWRGRTLVAAKDLSIRPTADRAKQTIFDILATRMGFDGVQVLDLFSGSGSLGLEALSRGAASVTFVERSLSSIDVLRRNITSLGCGPQTNIVQAEAFWYLRSAPSAFDLVFVDPPYKLETIGELPVRLHESHAVRDGTWVVMEHGRTVPVPVPEEQYDLIEKAFGQTAVLVMHAKKATAAPERNLP